MHRPLIFNGLVYPIIFAILLFIFSKGQTPVMADVIFTTCFVIVLSIPVSLNAYILIPQFLKRERHNWYILWFSLLLLSFSFIVLYLLNPLLDLAFASYFFVAYASASSAILILIITLVATTLLKLAEDWFYFNTLENTLLKNKNEQVATQLSALRAQINPHFLFNALNVIYALSLKQKDTTAKAVLELADILRYIIYEVDAKFIELKDEIKLLYAYVNFQKLRFKERQIVELDIHYDDANYQLYPMLLLPLIENSFKYGISSEGLGNPIKIKLFQHKHSFHFSILNTVYDTKNSLDYNTPSIGLNHVKTNLNLVYPNKHEFTVIEQNGTFKVELTIYHE